MWQIGSVWTQCQSLQQENEENVAPQYTEDSRSFSEKSRQEARLYVMYQGWSSYQGNVNSLALNRQKRDPLWISFFFRDYT
jgi:hypothetical protein